MLRPLVTAWPAVVTCVPAAQAEIAALPGAPPATRMRLRERGGEKLTRALLDGRMLKVCVVCGMCARPR